MRNITVAISFLTLFIFTSCSNTNQVLLPNESYNSENNSVSIMLIESEHLFNYFPNHTYGALRSTERNIFDNQMLKLFSDQTQSPVVGKKRNDNVDPSNFELREFETNSSKFTIISPKAGTDLLSSEDSSRYTLILDQYHFVSYQIGNGGGSYAGHEQETQNKIRFDLSYIIWDNKLQKEIGWGKVSSDHLLYKSDIAKSYQNVISSVFQKIVNVSPFQPV